ncbi:hypothetical protein [Brachybacterium tyrofermentans]|uniref:hypothetical protein n=1 Tax=Brachybacterium tyrofermentans TaxID=47848 RepID=UPI003FD440E8
MYLTTDVDSARRYATNYLGPDGTRPPGDVYEVTSLGKLLRDPDYPQIGHTEGAFLMTSSAVVKRVVARGVELSDDEKWRFDARHAHWALDDGPVYDEDGHLQMSKPMAARGVSPEWLAIIRPWYDGRKLRQDGWFVARTAEELEEAFFDAIPQLDTTHPVEQRRRFQLFPSKLVCAECGEGFGADQQNAAIHQLGEAEVQAVSTLLGEGSVYPSFLVAAARRRHPERWSWITRP